MADENINPEEKDEPVIRDKRRIDPETGDVREPQADSAAAEEAGDDSASSEGDALSEEDRALLDQAERDLVAEMRNDMLRAQAELVNFRTRVERDRAANREAVIAEVFRTLLPTIDDLARAEAHGDLVEGAPVTLIAQKLRTAFDKYGLKPVGEKGEPFDPAFHEAVVQLPTPDVTENTVADVIELGYVLGERLIRPAKVAVSVPAE
ncbi:nucleotide exchange factor GrpE [Salinibacterium soli]|uniref:Protein GrpE n=1 Tax=Antiquaquibacter soli TaxID=3064523 RepID=A0ABT9BQ43_9MICO|nr:nucleotide exchange factor GrpE [Protaetiibacter sp. WY-16]MDO7883064.1 nucleotide exchange factor GrpE [Protaetiibacter sp. WY-16]